MARTDPRPHYGTKRRTRADGYIDVFRPEHPLARRDGYVAEHRLVAWDAGLLTSRTAQVHHKNGDRQDNRVENLEPVEPSEHGLRHAEERGSVRNQHGEWPVKPVEQRASSIERNPEHTCPECSTVFSARADAIYCGERCRIRSWKRMRRAGSPVA